jgi:hypothetical protein
MAKSKTIIDKIKESGVKPRPKWYFKINRMLHWTCYALCILVGAASFSVILYAVQQTDYNLLSHLSHSKLEFFLGMLPFFWVLILLAFLFFAVIIFRKSPRGYKYNWPALFAFSTASSIVIGSLFFVLGGGKQLENVFAEKVGTYESINEQKIKHWSNPEAGFLGGTLDKTSEGSWRLIDFNDTYWEIEFKNAFISPRVKLEAGTRVKLTGQITSPNHFKVKEMRPWVGRHGSGKSRPSGNHN